MVTDVQVFRRQSLVQILSLCYMTTWNYGEEYHDCKERVVIVKLTQCELTVFLNKRNIWNYRQDLDDTFTNRMLP